MGAQTNNGEGQLQDGEVELRSENFLFRIREKSQNKVDIEVIDTKTFKFATNANTQTLKGAISKTQEKNLKLVIIPSLNDEKQSLLKLVLKVCFDFIPHFEETIILIERQGISESEKLQIQLRLTNTDIDSISKEISTYNSLNSKKHVWVVKDRQYSQVAETILSFDLPKGKYFIAISFFYTQQSGLIYFTLKQNNVDQLNLHGNIIYQVTSNPSVHHPRYLTAIVNITQDKETIKFESPNCNSYPWNGRNMIVSATLI